jgi:murein L,D-transpeptidase YcbB/YkuD
LRALATSATPMLLLHRTLPVDPGFWRLRAAYAVYRDIDAAGGWGGVPDGPKLQVGDAGPRIEALRQRLFKSGDLAAAGTGAFDSALAEAVQRFQARHGLATDAVVGVATLGALNQSVAQRLAVMRLNLRRLQAQDRHWGERYVAVNIAAATYRLVAAGQIVLEHPAVVGKPTWQTPTLDSVIDRVEFHPYWRIPMRIAEQEVWPKQDADPDYFASHGIRIIDDQLRQDPGPSNPLGDVKFLFDNPYSVYLHDTTSPGLFDRASRFFSHGCIRVSSADELARELLAADPQWSAARVAEVLGAGGNRTVTLVEPIAVHIVYDTAWVDPDGTIQFRNDVYGRDRLAADTAAPIGTCAG